MGSSKNVNTAVNDITYRVAELLSKKPMTVDAVAKKLDRHTRRIYVALEALREAGHDVVVLKRDGKNLYEVRPRGPLVKKEEVAA